MTDHFKNQSLPNGWEESQFKDIAAYIQRGKSPKYAVHSNFPVINQKCIRWHGIDLEFLKYLDPNESHKWSQERYLQPGDILWNSTGTGTIGRANIYKGNIENAVADSHVTIIRLPTHQILPEYVLYFIMSPYVQKNIESMQSGSTDQVELGKTVIEETKIPLPPFTEQKRIVAKIEELFSEIDMGIENLLKTQEILKAYRQAILKSAFEGKLTEKWRKDNDIQNWRIEKLENLTTKVGSGATPRGGRDVYKQEGIPLIRSMNVHFSGFSKEGLAFIDESQAKSLDNASVKTGDVLLNITGASIGRVSKAPQEMEGARVNQHVCIIRCLPKILNHTFLQYFLSSPDIQHKIFLENYGVTRQALTKSQILELRIPLPVLEEQELIANQLFQIFINLSSIEECCVTQVQLLSQLRQTILKNAFLGKLVPQNSSDEPANILLEHIKAEKEIPKPPKKKSKQLQKVAI